MSAPSLGLLVRAAESLRSRPDLVRSRLRYLQTHPDRLAEVARNSYLHSNGFAKIKIAEGHGFCARLHIWPAEKNRLGDVNPHGHRWEFASWVAVGEGMTERYFDEVEAHDPTAGMYVRCEYGSPGSEGRLRRRGQASLRARPKIDRPSNSIYTCTRDVVHTVAPVGDGLVATVVLQGPVRDQSTVVYVRPGREIVDHRRPITSVELYNLLGAVRGSIKRTDDLEALPSSRRARTVSSSARASPTEDGRVNYQTSRAEPRPTQGFPQEEAACAAGAASTPGCR